MLPSWNHYLCYQNRPQTHPTAILLPTRSGNSYCHLDLHSLSNLTASPWEINKCRTKATLLIKASKWDGTCSPQSHPRPPTSTLCAATLWSAPRPCQALSHHLCMQQEMLATSYLFITFTLWLNVTLAKAPWLNDLTRASKHLSKPTSHESQNTVIVSFTQHAKDH